VEEWIRIAEIPGKSKLEQARGAYVKKVFEEEGLQQITVDSIGNVTGVRKGTGGGPTIAIAAHIDIVFGPEASDGKVRRVGDTLFAPGVGDNTASVANMLATLRAMNATKFTSKGDIIFIGTTQEELGLKGMAYWLDHNKAPDLLIVPDGAYGVVSYGALGIYWTKYVFTSAGVAHACSRGKPTPVRAVAEAIDRLYALEFPALPDGAVMNIGQVHGGEIFNSVPQELYFTVDLRSPDPVLLDSLDAQITRITKEVAEAQKVGVRVESRPEEPGRWHRKAARGRTCASARADGGGHQPRPRHQRRHAGRTRGGAHGCHRREHRRGAQDSEHRHWRIARLAVPISSPSTRSRPARCRARSCSICSPPPSPMAWALLPAKPSTMKWPTRTSLSCCMPRGPQASTAVRRAPSDANNQSAVSVVLA
jgi:metal-dependent amidase/aminoacylase/carboxypeptidase family protein